MSTVLKQLKGLKTGITGRYSGKIGGIVIQKNNVVRITRIFPKRK